MDYTIKNVQKRGEWSMNGNPMQDYAIALEGDNHGWIKLTQKPDTRPPQIGDRLTGELQKKFDKNKNEYWKFKKVTPDGRGGGGFGGGSGIKQEDIDYIILMLEEMTLRRPAPDNPRPRSAQSDPAPTQDDDPFAGLL